MKHKLNEPISNRVNLKEEILKEHSKARTLYLSNQIGDNQALFDELFKLVFGDDLLVSQRGVWILRYCVESYPFLIDNYISALVRHLEKPVHDAIPRNLLLVLKGRKLNEEDKGILADICFRYLESPHVPVAIRSNAMSILYDICKDDPYLANDLKLTIETFMPHSSAGFKSRGRKVINALEKKSKSID